MKKIGLALVLGLVMAGTAVFADHPGGWGIGGVWGSWRNWDSNYGNSGFAQDFGLSLKAPQLPIFWGAYLNMDSYTGVDHFGITVTGDYYFIDDALVPDIFLHWYLGAGGRFGFNTFSWKSPLSGSYSTLFLGARGVVGLSFQIPINKNALEIFLDAAPSLGIDIYMGDKWTGDSTHFPAGGWGWDFGLRFWF